jgi:phospholipid transport system substrate-binding protein
MTKIIKKLTVFTLLILFNINTSVMASNLYEEEKIKNFMNGIGNATINLLSDQSQDDEAKIQKLNDLFKRVVNIKWIGDFSLGRYIRNITPEQHIRYDAVFSKFLVNNYVSNFRKFTKESFVIERVSLYKENQYMVYTSINRPSKPPLKVNYLVRPDTKRKGEYIIHDIIAEGVSLITTERTEFGSILANSDIEFLISELQKRTESN